MAFRLFDILLQNCLRMRRWCANQWQLSWDSASYQKRNNTRSSLKNTSYYCYKAQLQFVGWLKQHLRRTGFRGQRCLPGGEGESCPGSWHLDKLLERSRCRVFEAWCHLKRIGSQDINLCTSEAKNWGLGNKHWKAGQAWCREVATWRGQLSC